MEMCAMQEDFLGKACVLPWKSLGIANPEGSAGGVVRANNIYIECELPFVVAAQSVESPRGEEHFGLCIVHQPEQVARFLQGPYPPHNPPNMASWEKLFDEDIAGFLGGVKSFRVLKKTVVTGAGAISTLTELKYGLVLAGAEKEITIYADDVVPMTVCVTSSPTSIGVEFKGDGG